MSDTPKTAPTLTLAPMGIGLAGLAVAFPERVRGNEWWPASFVAGHAAQADRDVTTAADRAAARGAADVDPEVARWSARYQKDPFRGTRRRRVLGEGEQPSEIEAAAAEAALADAGRRIAEVDLLLSFSLVNDRATPLNHVVLADRLGLPVEAAALSLVADCASFLVQLRVACSLIGAGEHRRALIVCSSAASRFTDYDAPSSVNVGDGAAAAVIERLEPGHGLIAATQLTRADLRHGIVVVPAGQPEVPWYAGDRHRSPLRQSSLDPGAVHEMGARATTLCRGACEPLLARAGYRAADVDLFIASQPTAWFGAACCEALGIDPARTLNTFAEYAHPMPASAPLNLWAAHQQGRLARGDLVLLYSPGVGFIRAAALYRWLPPRSTAGCRPGGRRARARAADRRGPRSRRG